MSGDRMQKSVWMDEVCLRRFPKLEGDLGTDVLIVGGGMAGILCAWRLNQAGVDCALIEAGRIGRGVTGRTTGKITSQHGFVYHELIRCFGAEGARMYYEANQAALEEYRQLSRQYVCDFEIKKNCIFSGNDPQKLEQEWEALEKLGIPALYSKQVPVPVETCGGIFFPDQAQFSPLKLLAGITKGLQIYEHTPAREFGTDWVKTDTGMIRAEKIIVATHFPVINKRGAFFLKLHQERSYVLGMKNGPQINGMFLDDGKDGFSFRNYADQLLLGGGGHRTGKQSRGWEPLVEFARKAFPKAEIQYRWATQDCMTLDGVPYIGQYSPKTPNLYVATGFNKWGMSSAMAASMILTDLVLERDAPWAGLFDPSRPMLAGQLLKNAAHSVVGLLTPTKPRCPHMGCALKWNPQERSWDCPCHGSRFDERGKLLDNPANADAENTGQ